jgi:hypothetical protein
MQLRDNIGDRVPHAWNFRQAILSHDIPKRLGEGHQIFRCSGVGPRTVRVSAA